MTTGATAAPGVDALAILEHRLGVRFDDRELLVQALTHRSLAAPGYERLEFLGDSLLGFLVAEALYNRFPSLREGELTRLRALLVRRETLAEIAREIELGSALRLGEGELKSGGYTRDSILADAVEALIGAVYRDRGMDSARRLVAGLLAERIEAIRPDRVLKDAKTRLQEFQQKHGRGLPVYEVLEAVGPEHARSFVVRCTVDFGRGGQDYIGHGRSRRVAEQEAAAAACRELGASD